jgi:hypothetical protein
MQFAAFPNRTFLTVLFPETLSPTIAAQMNSAVLALPN